MALNADALMGMTIPPSLLSYDDRDTLLYALSLGAGLDSDLSLVQEVGQRVIPSFGQNLAFDDSWMEAAGIDLALVVHAGLELSFHEPFTPAGEVKVRRKITGLTDKGDGKAALVRLRTDIQCEGRCIFTSNSNLFVRGAGGFGGSVGEQPQSIALPSDLPGDQSEVATRPDQALLFRLLGDRNQLHSVPEVAQKAGFDGPILHGACTFGIACLTVLEKFCSGDPEKMRALGARFAGPLYPGECMIFDFWDQPDAVYFTAHAKERGMPVLTDGKASLA